MHNSLTEKIIGATIGVHRLLGLGLLESAYQECLHYELKKMKLSVEKQKALPIVHEAQILTYLKLRRYPIGLLINFHTKLLKSELRRFINTV